MSTWMVTTYGDWWRLFCCLALEYLWVIRIEVKGILYAPPTLHPRSTDGTIVDNARQYAVSHKGYKIPLKIA